MVSVPVRWPYNFRPLTVHVFGSKDFRLSSGLGYRSSLVPTVRNEKQRQSTQDFLGTSFFPLIFWTTCLLSFHYLELCCFDFMSVHKFLSIRNNSIQPVKTTFQRRSRWGVVGPLNSAAGWRDRNHGVQCAHRPTWRHRLEHKHDWSSRPMPRAK